MGDVRTWRWANGEYNAFELSKSVTLGREAERNEIKDLNAFCLFCSQEGGYSCEFLVGVCRLVLLILSLFQTKTCHFTHPFSDLAS